MNFHKFSDSQIKYQPLISASYCSTFNLQGVCDHLRKYFASLDLWHLPVTRAKNTWHTNEVTMDQRQILTSKNMDFQGEFWKWKPLNSIHYSIDRLLLTRKRSLLLKSRQTCEYPEGYIARFLVPKTTVGWNDISLQAAIPGRCNEEAASLVHFVSPCYSFCGEFFDVSCLE